MLLGFTRTLPNAARLRSTSQPPPFCDTATFARTRQTRAQLQQDRRANVSPQSGLFLGPERRGKVVARAESDGNSRVGETAGDGNDDSLVRVTIDRVQSVKNAASILYLSLKDGSGSLLPVYVGEAECLALEMEISNKRNTSRPIMYDLFKSFIETASYELSHVVIDDLKAKTYHATCYFTKINGAMADDASGPQETKTVTIELDSRPSDALNLAVRFAKPVFVTRHVLSLAKDFLIPTEKLLSLDRASGGEGARKQPTAELRRVTPDHMSRTSPLSKRAREEIEASVRSLLLHYVDADLIELQARLQIAIAKERFEDACAIRDEMDEVMNKDRMTAVCVAMESAVNDKRFEEAAVLRNTFLFLKEQKKPKEAKAGSGQAGPANRTRSAQK